jgi:hypothetical protein
VAEELRAVLRQIDNDVATVDGVTNTHAGELSAVDDCELVGFYALSVDDVILTRHVADDVPPMLDEICDAYADAYGEVAGEDSGVKSTAFRERATSALDARNYEIVLAHAGEQIVGFVFGYSLRPEREW